ncbi:MAG: immunity 22 family protein [Pirellulales bacterium]
MRNAFVWVGRFNSLKDFRKYCNSSKPSGSFEGDFPFESDGESYYETFRAEGETLRQSMLRLYNSAGYLDEALQALKKARIKEADINAVRVVDARQRQKIDPAGWPKLKEPLRFLGQFPFSERTPLVHPELNTEPKHDHDGKVSIWIGTLSSAKAADKYLEEQFESEDRPMSKFAGDFRLVYDPDYLFGEYSKTVQPVDKLLAGWPDARVFLKSATAAAAKVGVTQGNYAVVAYDLDYSAAPPFSTTGDAGYERKPGKPNPKAPVQFIGAFSTGKKRKS